MHHQAGIWTTSMLSQQTNPCPIAYAWLKVGNSWELVWSNNNDDDDGDRDRDGDRDGDGDDDDDDDDDNIIVLQSITILHLLKKDK
ncbi:Hypothetical predicted protein [Paramuricea clavata]|uniref:Uncharacterized protein n=1 Tax=Paramuricea clavata TaxID=317549 RepID=A0A7D9L7D6_PARCT|nr:Hypothetical predicted protein [Paramuricea clavata]